jgi:hypothetical protein
MFNDCIGWAIEQRGILTVGNFDRYDRAGSNVSTTPGPCFSGKFGANFKIMVFHVYYEALSERERERKQRSFGAKKYLKDAV